MTGESSPTKLRASILSVQTIFSGIGTAIGSAIAIVCIALLGEEAIGMICMIAAIPPMVAALLILFTKIGETKGIDLDTVRGIEWD